MFCDPLKDMIRTTFRTSKFRPKKSPQRQIFATRPFLFNDNSRLCDLKHNYGPPQVRLDKDVFTFENGKWLSEVNSGLRENFKELEDQKRLVVEENKYLHTKVEVLVDMLSETTAKLHITEDKLRSLIDLGDKFSQE
ncbi:protein chibby homolog 1-like [Pelodytes ibericus]